MSDLDYSALQWILSLEKSGVPLPIPSDLYEAIKERLYKKFRNDFNLVREYGFYDKLETKTQVELT